MDVQTPPGARTHRSRRAGSGRSPGRGPSADERRDHRGVRPLFLSADAWTGGDYELDVQLGPRSDERLDAALRALWSHPDLSGPFLHADVEPGEQAPVAPAEGALGVASVLGTAPATCRCTTVADDEHGDILNMGLPLGSLQQAWPQVGGYPFLADGEGPDDARAWQEPLEAWLGSIGMHIARQVPFVVGFVCFEGPGLFDVDHATWRRRGVPAERPYGLLWPDDDGTMRWYPATRYGGFEPDR